MSAIRCLVLIPSYNTGPRLLSTVQEALAEWADVWVVVDGSTDGSDSELASLAAPGLRTLRRPGNGGKGAAVFTGAEAALESGFTHALVMDADGQHPAAQIREFIAAAEASPAALILGRPIFGPDAPLARLQGRKLSCGLVWLESLGPAIDDPLFGFRVYPLEPLVRTMRRCRFGRSYDFDPELAVRLFWAGCPMVNLPATCRYLSRADGGVSHFHYFRDNLRMIWLHTRLLTELLLARWPSICRNRRRRHS